MDLLTIAVLSTIVPILFIASFSAVSDCMGHKLAVMTISSVLVTIIFLGLVFFGPGFAA